MKAQLASLNSILRTAFGLGVLGATILLISGMFTARGAAQYTQGSSRSQPPPPVGTVAVGNALATPTSNTKASAPKQQPQGQEVKRADFGSWGYVARRDGHGVHAVVSYNPNSIQSLNAYVEANRTLARQLATNKGQRVVVNVTFHKYLAPDEFRAWAGSMGLDVKSTQLRFLDANDLSGTIAIDKQPNESSVLPQDNIDAALKSMRSDNRLREFLGVFYTNATMDVSRLPALANDPLVFLADVTQNVVSKDLLTSGVQGVGANTVTLNLPTPIWQMEKFGLMNRK